MSGTVTESRNQQDTHKSVQVGDTPLKFSSRDAADLHRAMVPAVVASSSVPVLAQTDASVVAETRGCGRS
jgi:hypothetical protein